jgi:hypothetical protein
MKRDKTLLLCYGKKAINYKSLRKVKLKGLDIKRKRIEEYSKKRNILKIKL